MTFSLQHKPIASACQYFGLSLAIGATSILSQSASAATPASDTTTIPVDLAGINTTTHEIAVLQVLSEICPPMLNAQQKQAFHRTYNVELHELMPTIENPSAALQYLSTQYDYKNVLRSVRTWTQKYPQAENRALCRELAEGRSF